MIRQRIPWFGIVLIVFGTAMLLDRLHMIDVKFSDIFWPLLMLFGLAKVGGGFSTNSRGRIFWGTMLFLYGLFFFLRSLDFVYIRPHMFLPATFLIFGIACLMTYMTNLRDWFLLILSLFLIGIGVAFILADLDYLSAWQVWDVVRNYWPIILILVGLGILFRRRIQAPNNPANT